MSPSQPLVYVSLLNYGNVALTLSCLDSLQQLDDAVRIQIIITDNASPDDSLVQLQARLQEQPDAFHLIESKQNLGFSGGNNLAIRYAMAQASGDLDTAYVWLLNNDTTVAPDSLSQLLTQAKKHKGIVGSLLLHPDGSYQQSGNRFNWWTGSVKGYPEKAVQPEMTVETLIGASMLIPLRAFEQVGLMDESYFLYFEDGELSLRLKQSGYPLSVCTQSKIYHRESATTGKKSRLTQYYYHRNRLYLFSQYAKGLQKLSIGFYAMFRLWRFQWQAAWGRGKRATEKKLAAQIYALALQDFWKGTRGPCPHNLNSLN